MKKIILALAIMLTGGTSAYADSNTMDDFKFALVTTFGNDSINPFQIGDQRDRYNSYNGYIGVFVNTPATVLEFSRARQMFTPNASFQIQGKENDRLWAGVINYQVAINNTWVNGVQTRFALGADVIGPQTGLGELQIKVHQALNMRVPHKKVLQSQIGDATYFSAQAEVAYPIEFGNATIRPFGEVRIGYEQLARVGMDIFFGGAPSVVSRDYVTGALYTPRAPRGWSVNVGLDYTYVFQSALYPERSPVEMISGFGRVRGAVVYQGPRWNAQFGMSAIGEQFVGQKGGWQPVTYITMGRSF